jgi:hypothetical protein
MHEIDVVLLERLALASTVTDATLGVVPRIRSQARSLRVEALEARSRSVQSRIEAAELRARAQELRAQAHLLLGSDRSACSDQASPLCGRSPDPR